MKYLVTLTRTMKVEADSKKEAIAEAESVWDYGSGGDTEDYEAEEIRPIEYNYDWVF